MENLLRETKKAIESVGHDPSSISFIGSNTTGHRCTWAEFETLADREYRSWSGPPEVCEDLVIVFCDGTWLSRGEYDGSEWWDYSKVPVHASEDIPITTLFGRFGDPLERANQDNNQESN